MLFNLKQIPNCSLKKALAKDFLLITPTQRMSRLFLVQSMHILCPRLDSPIQEPRIQHFSGWLNNCVEEQLLKGGKFSVPLHRSLLKLLEEQYFWELVIVANNNSKFDSDLDNSQLLTDQDLAVLASRAHHHAIQKQLVTTDAGYFDTEWHQFQQWHQQYMLLCAEKNVVDLSCHLQNISIALHSGELNFTSDNVVLCGFFELTALEQGLLLNLQKQGIKFFVLTLNAGDLPDIQPRVCVDPDSELRLLATWVADKLEQGIKRILVAAPNLQQHRMQLLRIFSQMLPSSGTWLGELDDKNRSWNLNLDTDVTQIVGINSALQLLSLCCNGNENNKKIWPVTELLQLICLPGLGNSELEINARMRLNVSLQSQLQNGTSLAAFLSLLKRLGAANDSPSLVQQLSLIEAQLRASASACDPVKFIVDLLHNSAWPGDLQISESCVQFISQQIDRLIELHHVIPFSSTTKVFELFFKMCTSTSLRVNQNELAPVQIIDLKDAAGQEFDAVWIFGLHHEAWPEKANPVPFLPQLGQYNQDSEQLLDSGHKIMSSISYTRPAQGVISYAATDGVHAQFASTVLSQRFSPNLQKMQIAPSKSEIIRQNFKSKYQIKWQFDDYGPEFDDNHLPQGIPWLTCQALSPLIAFTRYRLHATGLKDPQDNIPDGLFRGELAHYALEALWRSIKTHAQLAAIYAANQEVEVIQNAIDHACVQISKKNNLSLTAKTMELEKTRLKKLLQGCIELDKNRVAGFRVAEIEAELQIEISVPGRNASLSFQGRVDRIDLLANNKLLLIDYKTHVIAENLWLDKDRLLVPQLPLYAVSKANTCAAFFVLMNPESSKWSGVIDSAVEAIYLPSKKGKYKNRDWRQLLEKWQKQLEELAIEIVTGYAGAKIYDTKKFAYQPEKIMFRKHNQQDKN